MIATHLKVANRKEVFDCMRTKFLSSEEGTTKTELSRQTGISAPTLMKISDFFLREGLIEEGEEVIQAIGRPSQVLHVNKDCMYAAGFLLEGVYLYMGVVDILGSLVYRKVVQTEPDLRSVLERIQNGWVCELLEEAKIPEEKLVGIGLAMPVSYNMRTRTVSNGSLVHVNGEWYIGDYLEKLERRYGVPVFFENDANAECLGADRMLNLFAGGGDILLLSLGTGIGAALMLDGHLRRGYHEHCGEIWSSIVSGWEEPGREERLEKQISLWNVCQKHNITYRNMAERMKNEQIRKTVDEIAGKLAVVLYNANALLDCRNIVLCGQSVELLGTEFLDAVKRYLKKAVCADEDFCLRVESPYSGISGIAGQCIEYRVDQILRR